MRNWDDTYRRGEQANNVLFPEQFLIRIFNDSRVNFFLKDILNPSLLDLGCGLGRNLSFYQTFTSDITCLDPSPHAVEFVQSHHGLPAYQFKPPNLELRAKFDVIVACNSIYYLEDHFEFGEYLLQVLSCLKVGGLFVVSFIGREHSILDGSEEMPDDCFILKNSKAKFYNRIGQRLFSPGMNFELTNFKLKKIICGEIKEKYDQEVRHLHIYCCQKTI